MDDSDDTASWRSSDGSDASQGTQSQGMKRHLEEATATDGTGKRPCRAVILDVPAKSATSEKQTSRSYNSLPPKIKIEQGRAKTQSVEHQNARPKQPVPIRLSGQTGGLTSAWTAVINTSYRHHDRHQSVAKRTMPRNTLGKQAEDTEVLVKSSGGQREALVTQQLTEANAKVLELQGQLEESQGALHGVLRSAKEQCSQQNNSWMKLQLLMSMSPAARDRCLVEARNTAFALQKEEILASAAKQKALHAYSKLIVRPAARDKRLAEACSKFFASKKEETSALAVVQKGLLDLPGAETGTRLLQRSSQLADPYPVTLLSSD